MKNTCVAIAPTSCGIEKPRSPENWGKIGQKLENPVCGQFSPISQFFLPIILLFSDFRVLLVCSWSTQYQHFLLEIAVNITWPQLGPFFVPACPPLTAINGAINFCV